MRFMKAVVLIVFFVVGCGMPITRTDIRWPGEADTALDKMVLTLQDNGYTILNVSKPSGVVLARKITGIEQFASAIGGTAPKPYQVSISVQQENDHCMVKIVVTHPGEILKDTTVTRELSDEIIRTFKQYAGSLEVIKQE